MQIARPNIIFQLEYILFLWDLRPWLKKSVETYRTRPICNQLEANHVNIDTKYETRVDRLKLNKTRWTRPSSRDDSIDSVKIQRIEYQTEILCTNNQKNIYKKKIQTFRDSFEKPKHSKLETILTVMEFQITKKKKKNRDFT